MTGFFGKTGNSVSVKRRLIFFFALVAVIPLILTTIATSYFSREALMQAVYADNEKVAASLAGDLNATLAANIQLLQAMADTDEIKSMEQGKQLPFMKKTDERSEDISTYIVSDEKGAQTVRTKGALAENSKRDYFQKLLQGADYAVSDVQIGHSTGKASLVLAVPIRDEQKNFRGALLGVVDFDNLSKHILATRSGQNGYAFLADRQGKVIVHPDQELMKQMADVSSLAPVQSALSGKNGTVSYDAQDGKKLAGYSFVPLSGWGVVVQQPLQEAMTGANKVITTGILFTLFGILLAVLAGFFLAGIITKPMGQLVNVTQKLAEGDLTVTASVSTHDEMGRLALSFNTMAENLRELIRAVIQHADQVAASSEELSATANEAERATNQVAVTMSNFAQGSQKQVLEIESTLQVAEELTVTASNVAEKASSASHLSEDMDEDAQNGGDAAQNAVKKINEIKDVTVMTSGVISELGEKSKQIGEILDVISGIAGQTNLLALNAAIEAARAGEQGRGFAVVAEEVRKLAEQSQQATGQISQIIGKIRQQTGEAIKAMESGNSKVNEGVNVVQNAEQAFKNITLQIRKNVSMINDINAASEQQLESMQKMAGSAKQVASIAKEANAGAQTTAAATEEMTASMEQIASAAEGLAKTAGELQTMVMKFKI